MTAAHGEAADAYAEACDKRAGKVGAEICGERKQLHKH
jgi:hypothetical protein